jgi:D-amino-acid dehydrogenase
MPAKRMAINEMVALEPALKGDLAGGWYYSGDCHLKPDSLMAALKTKLKQSGCRIVEDFEVDRFVRDGKHGRAIVGKNGKQIEADAFVVATGAWTPFLNKQLGCRIPIQPGKGYSLTMPRPARMPRIPLILEEHRVAITPLRDKYRIGSTMEFAGYDTSINPARLNLLKTSAARYLHEPYAEPIEEQWYGWRPMTWDGKPIIDRSPAMNNVWIAAGHNMLGISMATGTGRLIQQLIDGEPPHVDPGPYAVCRF